MVYDDMKQSAGGTSFGNKEKRCNQVFQWAIDNFGGIWHLCTPGEGQPVIFTDKEDYTYMMILIAICSYVYPSIHIVTFEIMSNHLHILICGKKEDILSFFDNLKKKLRFYLAKRGADVNLKHFGCVKLIPVESLESIRNQIVYINRNNYVVDPNQTPFSYPFGANSYYFSPAIKRSFDGTFGELPKHDRRKLVHSKDIYYPDTWLLYDGYISPSSYVRFDIGEGVFRDARHYFHKISRDIESYKDIALQLGESVYYTDDELIAVVYRICRQNYDCENPALLPSKSRLELARTLHFNYNADNGKIARLLKLDKWIIDEQFPLRR